MTTIRVERGSSSGYALVTLEDGEIEEYEHYWNPNRVMREAKRRQTTADSVEVEDDFPLYLTPFNVCHECGKILTHPAYTSHRGPDVDLQFCSSACLSDYQFDNAMRLMRLRSERLEDE